MRRPESVPGPASLDHWHPNEISARLSLRVLQCGAYSVSTCRACCSL